MSNGVENVDAKYVFIDIVGFTRDRTAETQAGLVRVLNEIIQDAVKLESLSGEGVIYLPTGDGVCIAVLGSQAQFDAHMNIAVTILRNIASHNAQMKDDEPHLVFGARVGVNENLDILVTDINGSRNVAGPGINEAQRVMNVGDSGHIMVGETTYKRLCKRDKYVKRFRRDTARIKHNETLAVYQYLDEGARWLNSSIPDQLVKVPARSTTSTELDVLTAHYFALAQKYRKFWSEAPPAISPEWSGCVLLWYLAQDFVEKAKTKDFEVHYPATAAWGDTFADQFAFLQDVERHIVDDLALRIHKDLQKYANCFERDKFGIVDYRILGTIGVSQLLREYAALVDLHGLDRQALSQDGSHETSDTPGEK